MKDRDAETVAAEIELNSNSKTVTTDTTDKTACAAQTERGQI